MNKQMITTALVVLSASVLQAEIGLNFMIGYGYEADIGIVSGFYGANDPGDTSGTENHKYDDGFVLVDSTGNFDRGSGTPLTSYWGYQDTGQYDSGAQTITMSSLGMNVQQRQGATVSQDGGQPGIEFWWKEALLSGDEREEGAPLPAGAVQVEENTWSIDVRAAVRWQRIEMDYSQTIDAEAQLVSDSYSTSGNTPPLAPFSGTFEGPNMLLESTPSRSIATQDTSLFSEYNLEASIFALDLGPAFTVPIGENFRCVLSGGLTLAYVKGEYDHKYEDVYLVTTKNDDTLFGGYLSADVIFQDTLSLGLATFQLQDFEMGDGSSYANISFKKSFAIRLGLAF